MEEEFDAESSDSGESIELVTTRSYVEEAKNLIYKNDEITIQNSILFNKKLQINLLALKSKLENMLIMCVQKYKDNEKLITELSERTSTKMQHRNSFYLCGYPYFKNRDGFPAPLPDEYHIRKKNELFPLALNVRNVHWIAKDKMLLIQGVKKQLVQFIQMKNRDKIRTFTTRTKTIKAELISNENSGLSQQKLTELLSMIDPNEFKIDWFTISMESLDDRHSSNECEGMWNGYLNPSFNRNSWSEEEEDHLLDIVLKHNIQNWDEIANEMNNRSAYQCFVHYRAILSNKNDEKFSRWTKEEDDLLLKLKNDMQIGSMVPWTKIATKMSGRSKLQIYHRFTFSLNPEINRNRFTVEEDCILMAAVKEYGQNFQIFPPNLLPGRTSVQIRNRYNNVLKHVGQRDHWAMEHDQRLMDLVMKYGESDWAKIAQELGSHNRTSCRSRYNTIKKFLQKNPNSTVENVPRRKRAFSTNVTADNWMETIIREKHRDLGLIEINEYNERRTFAGIVKSPLGMDFYDYFRFSFNFQYGQRHVAPAEFMRSLSAANKILNSSHVEEDFKNSMRSDYTDLSNVQRQITNEKTFNSNCLFPIDYNTIVGLRGLTILFESKDERTSAPEQSQRKSEIISHPSLDLFKQRFLSIFKNTALLAKSEGGERGVRVRLQRESVLPKRFQSEVMARNDMNASGINETIFIVSDVTNIIGTGDGIPYNALNVPTKVEKDQNISYDCTLNNENGNYNMVIYNKSDNCEAGPSGVKRVNSTKPTGNSTKRKKCEK